jgi:hypothetical protein
MQNGVTSFVCRMVTLVSAQGSRVCAAGGHKSAIELASVIPVLMERIVVIRQIRRELKVSPSVRMTKVCVSLM